MKIKRFSVREIILSLLFFIAGYRINLSSDSDSELHVKLKEKVESKLQTSPLEQVGFDQKCLRQKQFQCKSPKLTKTESEWWKSVRRATSAWASRAWPNKADKLCFNIHNFSKVSEEVFRNNPKLVEHTDNFLLWSLNLVEYERAVFSLAGSDGILEETFKKFGVTNKKYLEIGTGKGALQCNTRYFREVYGWTGIMLDKKAGKESIGLFRYTANSDTICSFIASKGIPHNLDLFSLDIDGIDYHILNAIMKCGYKPRVIIAEYNPSFGPLLSAVAPNNAKVVYEQGAMGTATGSSLFALIELLNKYGYSLYYCDRHGLDSYFIHQTLLQGQNLALQLWSTILYRFPAYRSQFEQFDESALQNIEFFGEL